MHGAKHEFVLHFDLDTIAGEEFPWTNSPGSGGLSLTEVRDALRVFASQANLAAINVAGYNPELDPNGKGVQVLIDLLVEALATRLKPGSSEGAAEADLAAELFPKLFLLSPLVRSRSLPPRKRADFTISPSEPDSMNS